MKAEMMFVWPQDEPATLTSRRWLGGKKDLNDNKFVEKHYANHSWLWERCQETAAMRHALHKAREEAMYMNYCRNITSLPN